MGYAANMSVESPVFSGNNPSEAELLETFLLMTLEAHDGLCLDNQPEREVLAKDLAAALVTAANDGTLELARLMEPLQTGEYPASASLTE